ncbi:heterokaryon incompatibility protein [Ilyonectria robusta]
MYCEGVQVGRQLLIREMGSPVNLGIAKGWLDDCRDNHTLCRPVGSSRLPTRVLDIGTSEGLSHCRLLETDSKEGCYVALSHCWGGEIPERLTKETRPTLLSSIQIANLPANFRDAIHVTRQLNMQYLWIDALFIVQDSREDWAAESAKMDSIYQDATLTIFAAESKGSREGFLKTAIQPQPTPTTLRVFTNPDIQTSVLVTGRAVEEESFYDMESRSALARRGWAYQESCLSRRSLYFGARQLYWECFEAVDNLEELLPALTIYKSKMILPDASGKLEKGDSTTARRQFYEVVSGYTNDKALSRSEDKLPAFSGLAKRFHPFFGGEYLAGLWSEDFSSGLLWSRAFSALSSSYTAVEPYRAPSWSWASDNGWIMHFVQPSQTFLELHGWDIQPRSRHNPYGEIDPGGESARPSVIVSGQTMLFVRTKDIDDNGDRPSCGDVDFDVLEGPEEMVARSTDSNQRHIYLSIVDNVKIESYIYRQDWLEEDEDVPDPPSELSDEYLVLAVGSTNQNSTVWGLVLRKSGDAFQRVGLCSIETDSGEIRSWKGWEK